MITVVALVTSLAIALCPTLFLQFCLQVVSPCIYVSIHTSGTGRKSVRRGKERGRSPKGQRWSAEHTLVISISVSHDEPFGALDCKFTNFHVTKIAQNSQIADVMSHH